MPDAQLPLLVYVSGKPGAGKSTLARALTERTALGLPLLSADAVRRALEEPYRDTARSFSGRDVVQTFYALIQTFLDARLSLVVDLSFRRGLDEQMLQPLLAQARIVNLHCDLPAEMAEARFLARENDLAHAGAGTDSLIAEAMRTGQFDWSTFDPLDLDVPRLHVDTSIARYVPGLDEIVAFCREQSTVGAYP